MWFRYSRVSWCPRSSPDLWWRHSPFNSCNHNTLTPQSQANECSGPTYCMPQPCTRPGPTPTGKGMRLWADFEESCRHLHRQCIRPLCAHELHFTTPLLWGKGSSSETRKNIMRTVCLSPKLRFSALATVEQTLPLTWQQPWSIEEVLPHTVRKDMTGIHIQANPHALKMLGTQGYLRMLPPYKNPLTPQ